MTRANTVLIIVIALIIGGVLGFLGDRYVISPNYNRLNSLSKFVLNNPDIPWSADISGELTQLSDSSITFRLLNEEGKVTNQTYTLNLVPEGRLNVERLVLDSAGNASFELLDYKSLQPGDNVGLAISSSGSRNELVISAITLLPASPQ